MPSDSLKKKTGGSGKKKLSVFFFFKGNNEIYFYYIFFNMGPQERFLAISNCHPPSIKNNVRISKILELYLGNQCNIFIFNFFKF